MKIATILTIVGLVMASGSAASLWVHSHGERTILANKGAISTLATVSSINQDIRDLGKRCDSLRSEIRWMRSDLSRLETSAVQNDYIAELKNQLKNEIEDAQKLLEQKTQRLRDKEMQESKLIQYLATA